MKKIILLINCVVIAVIANAQSTTLDWAKSLGGSSFDYGESITTDASGNVYTIGIFAGTADFDPGPATFNLTSSGGEDVFISKLDGSGNFVWAKQLGGNSNDEGHGIAVDAAGNVFTCGIFAGSADFDPGPGVTNLISAGAADIFVSKLDASGNFIWAKNMGGSAIDYGLSLVLDLSGNVYTTGIFQGTADFDPGAATFNLAAVSGNGDIFISKLDSSGNFVWAKDVGGNLTDRSNSITIDGSGNIYTTGFFQGTTDFDPGNGITDLTSSGGQDIFILKLDASGNFVWARNMGGSSVANGYSVKADASGNIYTTGIFQSTVDFNPGPATFNLTSQGSGDIFISKLDGSGNFIWAKDIGGNSTDNGLSISTDVMGNAYFTGYFQDTVDFDPGPAVFNLIAPASFDIFILKLDASGNFLWADQMGGTGNDQGFSIAVDTTDIIYTTGYYCATADFDPGAGTFNLTPQGSDAVFITKMKQGTFTGTTENVLRNDVNAFPNPSNGQVNLMFDHSLNHATLLLFNTTGQTVMEKENISGSQFTLDLSDFANGVYFIEVYDGGKISRIKLIKD